MDLFFDENTKEGAVKKARMASRFLSPVFRSQEPAHRISWEQLQELIATYKQQIVEKMRQAEKGAEAADIYESLDTVGPIELFCKNTTQDFLPTIIPNYKPEHGFDWDVFMFVSDENVIGGISLYFEIFPRSEPGKMVQAYASIIKAEIPWFWGVRDNETDDLLATMGAFVYGDALHGETRTKQILERQRRWVNHQGMWPIENQPWLPLFINRAALSVMEDGLRGQRTIVSPGVTYDFDGVPKEASLGIK
jgi:hypothetical protein